MLTSRISGEPHPLFGAKALDAVEPSVIEAISWMVQITGGEATDAERREFDLWYAASGDNQRAWNDLSKSLSVLDSPTFSALPQGVLAERLVKSGASRRRVLTALCCVVAVAPVALAVNRVVPLQEAFADHLTRTGEIKQVALDDGTTLVLGPRTGINILDTDGTKTVEVLSGLVLFERPDVPSSRPLNATLANWSAALPAGRSVLGVRDGWRRATSIDAPLLVNLGDSRDTKIDTRHTLVETALGTRQVDADVELETRWKDDLLVVHDLPLSDVVAMIRPYFSGIIRLSDAVGSVRVGGVYHLANPKQVIADIGFTLNLSVNHITPYWITIDRA